jgi:hypothetical protein
MKHIRQRNSSTIPGEVYAVVITTDWNKPLEEHPSVVEHPEMFEVADCEIPDYIVHINYESY